MKAKSIRTDKVFKGKLATLMVKVGVAMPLDENQNKLSGAETIALINECETVEQLKVYEGDSRKTVLKAYNKKLNELN